MPRLPAHHRALALLAVASAGLAVGGCGGADRDVPSNAIARVSDQVIARASFDYWVKASVGAQASTERGSAAPVPDPPTFARCIAAKQKRRVPKGAKRLTPVQLKGQCREEYELRKDDVVQFLVSAAWVEQEAKKRGVEVPEAVIDRRLQEQRKQAFRTDKAYREYLRSSGVREEDIRYSIRIEELSNAISQKVVAGRDKVTDEQVADYYEKNKARFAQPERRDVEVVLTEDEAGARRARAEVRKGTSFAKVAKRFSIDATSKNRDGKLLGVVRSSQLGKPLENAIFGARRGELVGPVKTTSGYYVLRVTKVTEGGQPSLAEKRGAIRNVLGLQQAGEARSAFTQEFRDQYRKKTTCAEGFVVSGVCGNAPKERRPQAGVILIT
ncbi:MAG: peptidyl-prolyl cis-trans isomerase [Actinomycetota bacterium]|nr:peptidyl-prolyl cis-trans isomerase [Actinomycetota bacterium]